MSKSTFNHLPDSRAWADNIGSSHYFTGVPCKHGHVDKRLTSTGACAECMRRRQAVRRTTDQGYIEKSRVWGRERMRKVLSDPDERSRIRKLESERYRNSADVRAKKAASDKLRYKGYTDERRYKNKLRYHNHLKNDPEYKRKKKLSGASYAKNNAAKLNARSAFRRSLRIKATPKWLSEDHHGGMELLYHWARVMHKFTGVAHDVDHIVPLKNDLVCGLHVPWNLQVMTSADNRAKWNRFTLE